MEFSSLATVCAAFIIAVASPGPATLAVATVSLRHGRTIGLTFGLGLSAGLAVWGLVAATGLGAVLATSALALTVLKVLSGVYLLWLAVKSLRAMAQEAKLAPAAGVRPGFTAGLMLNLANPKAVFAWMAVLSLGVGPSATAGAVIATTALCVALGVGINAGYAVKFSTRGATAFYDRARKWIDGAAAILFAMAGFGLIRSALARA